MRIGHGMAELPVVPGEPLGGYADRSGGVADVLDPLEVHAVTFAAGDRRFVLVTADLVCVNTDVVATIRRELRRRLPVDAAWVAATHTHASPEAGCFPGGGSTPPDVAVRLVTAAVDAVTAAVAGEAPSRLHAVRTHVPGLAGPRSSRTGSEVALPVDALLCTVDDTVAGVLAVCPVHPTILPADNTRVSADLNGGIRRALAASGRWAVVATGAAGDISTRHTRRGRDAGEIDRLGRLAAAHIDRARSPAADGSPVPEVTPPAVEVVRLQPKAPEEIERLLAEPSSPGAVDDRTRWVLQQGRRLAADLARRPRREPYAVEVQAIGLGPVTLVAVPAEPFLELGEQIRATASRDGTEVIVLGYTNGYLGYLPTRDAPISYETYVSPVTSGSGELVVQAAVAAADRCRSPEAV